MSTHGYIYLGPYVECTYAKKKRAVLVFGCTSASCRKHPKARGLAPERAFCSACGAPNGQIQVEIDVRTHPYDVVGDALSEIPTNRRDDVLWLIPNERRAGRPRPNVDFDSADEFHMDLGEIGDVERTKEMVWLQEAFGVELAKLREAYSTATIKWGIHHYFM